MLGLFKMHSQLSQPIPEAHIHHWIAISTDLSPKVVFITDYFWIGRCCWSDKLSGANLKRRVSWMNSLFKGGTPNLEAPLGEVQKGQYMGQLLVPPWGEVGESEGPTLYVPRPSKLKKKEIILAGGAGGDGGVGMGRRGAECKIWIIQHYFYQSHRFFLVNLKVEVKTSLSLFVVVILSSWLTSLSIKVCIPPEEEALASKACEIHYYL